MNITRTLAVRNLRDDVSRYALATVSVAFAVTFMVASWLITGAIGDEFGGATVGLLLTLFGLLVMMASSFVVSNAFSAMMAARAEELAMLRAIGMRRDQVFRNVTTEGFAMGIVGSIIGLVAGAAVASGVVVGFLDGSPVVPGIGSIIGAFIVGIMTDLMAMWLPARRATRITPMEALSTSSTWQLAKLPASRKTLGSMILVLGLAIGLFPAPGTAAVLGFILGTMLVYIGLSMLGPLFVTPMSNWFSSRMSGSTIGFVAGRNLARNPRRTANSTMASVFGVTLFVGMATVFGTVEAMTEAQSHGGEQPPMLLYVSIIAGVTVIVGLVGIVNSLVMSIRERRDELAMMRSVGFTKGQLMKMLLVESGIQGLISAVLGVGFGIVGGTVLLVRLGVVPMVPVMPIVLVAVMSIALIVIASIIPARSGANARMV